MREQAWTKNARLLFLLGAPRSGTTWLQALVASHPNVSTGPETHFFEAINPLFEFFNKTRPRPDGLKEYLSEEEFLEEIKELFFRITSKVVPPEQLPFIFLEKTPQHVFYYDVILKCFPDAYFIHLVRDPRDVVASVLRAARTWGKGWFPDSVTIAAELWKRSVLEAQKIPGKIKDSKRFIEIKYENLVSDTCGNLSMIFRWLDLRFDDTLIKKIVVENELLNIKTKGQFNAIKFPKKEKKAVEPEGFFGMGKRSPNKLSWLERQKVENICAALLVELGYINKFPKISPIATLISSWKLRKIFGLKPF